jgi:hypothetical protein
MSSHICQVHEEWNQQVAVHPEPVEGLIIDSLNYLTR